MYTSTCKENNAKRFIVFMRTLDFILYHEKKREMSILAFMSPQSAQREIAVSDMRKP